MQTKNFNSVYRISHMNMVRSYLDVEIKFISFSVFNMICGFTGNYMYISWNLNNKIKMVHIT